MLLKWLSTFLRDVPLLHLLYYLLVVSSWERRLSREHDIHDHPTAPNVTFFIVVGLGKYFGSHIIWSAQNSAHSLAWVESLGRSKINNFDQPFLLLQNVLWLQVPVANAVVVAVIYCLKNLEHNFGCIFFREELPLHNFVEQLTPLTQFSDHVVSSFVLKHLVESEYVGVVHGLKHSHFVNEALFVPIIVESLFQNSLDCPYLPIALIDASVHLTVCSYTHSQTTLA